MGYQRLAPRDADGEKFSAAADARAANHDGARYNRRHVRRTAVTFARERRAPVVQLP